MKDFHPDPVEVTLLLVWVGILLVVFGGSLP